MVIVPQTFFLSTNAYISFTGQIVRKDNKLQNVFVPITVTTVTGPWQPHRFFFLKPARIYPFVASHLDTTSDNCLRLLCFLTHHFTMIFALMVIF